MQVKTAKTTVDITGNEILALIAEKISEATGEKVFLTSDQVAITYRYDKKADGKGYKKSDEIKRVRITL